MKLQQQKKQKQLNKLRQMNILKATQLSSFFYSNLLQNGGKNTGCKAQISLDFVANKDLDFIF